MRIVTDFNDQQAWNKFVAANSEPASFLQSWEWGEFNQKILGNQIQRWAVVNEKKIRITFLAIKKNLLANKFYYYSPRGIVWQQDEAEMRADAFGPLLKTAQNEFKGAVFSRMNPPYPYKNYLYGFLKRMGFKKPKILTQTKEPGKTLILDLNKSEEELLKEMHHKTRYNIKLAERKGLKVRMMNENSKNTDIDIFYNLEGQTAKRNKISVYNKDYYTKLVNYFSQSTSNVKLKLYIAEYQNKPLSSAIVIYFGNTATYLHGASSNECRELMPNHLMQWQIIKDAKTTGMKIYDFWGISEKNKDWAGITRFKKGFGGRIITFLGTWDYVLDKKWYNLLRILRLVKKIIP